jgi:hypothetical protein
MLLLAGKLEHLNAALLIGGAELATSLAAFLCRKSFTELHVVDLLLSCSLLEQGCCMHWLSVALLM